MDLGFGGFVSKRRGVYVNLLQNPERFTGYSGPSAARVWRSIQQENCFAAGVEETCFEKRTFYRFVQCNFNLLLNLNIVWMDPFSI